MAARGVDVLYVMQPANVVYLTGYSSIWHPTRAPLGVAISRSDPTVLLLDWVRHEDFARHHAFFDHLVLFTYANVTDTVTRALAERGWASGTVGIEWHTPVPAGPVVRQVADALRAAGATVVDGDWIVDDVRLIKSEAEIDRIRSAAAIADDSLEALRDVLGTGLTEREVAARLDLLLAERGGETPACPSMVSSGPLAWCRNHAFPSRRPLERGDTIYVDCCGAVDRYHANLCRTFALGCRPPRAVENLEVVTGSVAALQNSARLGDPLDEALGVAESYVRSRLPMDRIWWVGGYSLGLAQPPSWVGHAYLSNDAYSQPLTWQPGLVFNFENVFFDRDEGSIGAAIDTVVMTERGLDVLSRLPHELAVVGMS
jgi:Xaa-Pro aminopeptidase